MGSAQLTFFHFLKTHWRALVCRLSNGVSFFMRSIGLIGLIGLIFIAACSLPTNETSETIKTSEKTTPTQTIKTGDTSFLVQTGRVQYKRRGSVSWLSGQGKNPIDIEDWIRTELDSQAQIDLSDGRILDVGESSLVTLLEKSETAKMHRAVLGVSKGNLVGEVGYNKNTPSELIIKMPQVWVRIRSPLSEGLVKIFRISLTDKKILVHAIDGDLDLVWKGKVQTIKSKEQYMKSVRKAPEVLSWGENPPPQEQGSF
jgi:hypothetical protein